MQGIEEIVMEAGTSQYFLNGYTSFSQENLYGHGSNTILDMANLEIPDRILSIDGCQKADEQ